MSFKVEIFKLFCKNNNMFPIFRKIQITIFYVFYSIFYVILSNYRNDLYKPLYSSLEIKNITLFNQSVKELIIIFILLFLIEFINKYFKYWQSIKNRQRYNQLIHLTDQVSQNLAIDQKNIALYYCDTFFKLLPHMLLIMYFIPKMFHLMGTDLYFMSVFIIYCIFSFLLIFLLKSYYGKLYKNHLFFEEAIQNYLHSWFAKNKIVPIKFDEERYFNDLNNSFSFYMFDSFNSSFLIFYQSASLIIPFIVFFSGFIQGRYNFGLYMQIINLWTAVNYAIFSFFEAWENYAAYQASIERVNQAVSKQLNFEFGENIEIENLIYSINNKKILDIPYAKFKANEVTNLNGPHAIGKTTFSKAIMGYITCEGKIKRPKKICYIPENPTFPIGFKFQQNDQFIFYCEKLNINYNILFEQASGSEKWKLIAAYTLSLNCYVIWDDPLWGNLEIQSLSIFTKNLKGGLILTSQKIL